MAWAAGHSGAGRAPCGCTVDVRTCPTLRLTRGPPVGDALGALPQTPLLHPLPSAPLLVRWSVLPILFDVGAARTASLDVPLTPTPLSDAPRVRQATTCRARACPAEPPARHGCARPAQASPLPPSPPHPPIWAPRFPSRGPSLCRLPSLRESLRPPRHPLIPLCLHRSPPTTPLAVPSCSGTQMVFSPPNPN